MLLRHQQSSVWELDKKTTQVRILAFIYDAASSDHATYRKHDYSKSLEKCTLMFLFQSKVNYFQNIFGAQARLMQTAYKTDTMQENFYLSWRPLLYNTSLSRDAQFYIVLVVYMLVMKLFAEIVQQNRLCIRNAEKLSPLRLPFMLPNGCRTQSLSESLAMASRRHSSTQGCKDQWAMRLLPADLSKKSIESWEGDRPQLGFSWNTG